MTPIPPEEWAERLKAVYHGWAYNPSKESLKGLFAGIAAEIAADARKGMVPVEALREIIDSSAGVCDGELMRPHRNLRSYLKARHPELFTE